MCVQMLSFVQLPYLLLSDTALGFWTALLQQAAPRGESVAKLEKSPLPLDVAGALVDLAGSHNLQAASLCAHSSMKTCMQQSNALQWDRYYGEGGQ